MDPKKLPSASSREDSQLQQDKTVACSTFLEQSTRRTNVSSRFGFVQYVGVTRWIFADENNTEVRSLVSSCYPLLNLVTGFLPDLPGQLPSRNDNGIISATDKALPKQSASLGLVLRALCNADQEKLFRLSLTFTSLLHIYTKSY